jgi:glycopeptide antibiotics resistance protein
MLYARNLFFGAMSGFIPSLPIAGLFYFVTLKNKREEIRGKSLHAAGVCVFYLVLAAMLSVTGVPDLYSLTVDTAFNIIPFADLFSNFTQYVLDAVLFVPFGFLLPALWRRFEKKRETFLCGFFMALLIELTQIFTFRSTDIDDLLMNSAGTVIGCFLFEAVKKAIPKISALSVEPTGRWRAEPYFCFGAVWLVMFLIQPFAANWLWELIQ